MGKNKKIKFRGIVDEVEKTNKLLRAILLFLVKYYTPVPKEFVPEKAKTQPDKSAQLRAILWKFALEIYNSSNSTSQNWLDEINKEIEKI